MEVNTMENNVTMTIDADQYAAMETMCMDYLRDEFDKCKSTTEADQIIEKAKQIGNQEFLDQLIEDKKSIKSFF